MENNKQPQTVEFHKLNIPVAVYANKNVSIFENFSKSKAELSVSEVLSTIKTEKYKVQILKIRTYIANGNLEMAKLLKKKLESFTPSGTFKNGRNKDKLDAYNQIIILDIDKVNSQKLKSIQKTSSEIPFTLAHFISPSGNGLKILVGTNCEAKNHKIAYSEIAKYYSELLQIEIDSSGSDVSRLCFMSYDPDCFTNNDFEPFQVQSDMIIKSKQIQPVKDDFETTLLQIENNCVDITGDYETWRNIGFAIADEFGEAGRESYHRICCFHPTYDKTECDEQYSNCITSEGSGIGISTFYYHAKNNNFEISKTSLFEPKREDPNLENEIKIEIPTFSQSIEENIPEFFKRVIEPSKSLPEKDMMLLGAISSLSSGLPNLYGIYDGDVIHPNLYLFITAAASAGKGKLKYCKRLIMPIHKEIRKKGKLMKAEYDQEMSLFNQTGKKNSPTPAPEKPPTKMFIFPADNSATGFFQLLSDNDGKGLIFETEADTLANNFKKDYGNYSDGFRNAFHHEPIGYFRRTGNENVEIDYPQLSCVLSGTPKQVLALMPNAENGLFSRFIFYELPISYVWKNVFEVTTKNGMNNHFDALGNEFIELYHQLLEEKEIHFTYTSEQKTKLINLFI